VMCVVEAIDAVNSCNLHNDYGFGEYSDLAANQVAASSLNLVDLIKKLNNEF
jgi:hypothetical protein